MRLADCLAGGVTNAPPPGRGAVLVDDETRIQIEFTIVRSLINGCHWAKPGFDWNVSAS